MPGPWVFMAGAAYRDIDTWASFVVRCPLFRRARVSPSHLFQLP